MKKRGRPKSKISEKKEALLLAAEELFRANGYNKVTIDEICEKAQASKMTFYRQFRDKTDIALFLVKKNNLEAKELLVGIFAKAIPFPEKFAVLTELNEQFHNKMGLLFLEDLISSKDPEIIKGLQSISKTMEKLNFQFIEMGKSEGFLNPDFKVEFIIYLIEKTRLLFKDPELNTIYPDFSEKVNSIREFFYHGIMSKKKTK